MFLILSFLEIRADRRQKSISVELCFFIYEKPAHSCRATNF